MSLVYSQISYVTKKQNMSHVMIGTDVLTVCNLYLISVGIVGCCKRLITSFNGGFVMTGERRIDFSFESNDSSGGSISSSESKKSSSLNNV